MKTAIVGLINLFLLSCTSVNQQRSTCQQNAYFNFLNKYNFEINNFETAKLCPDLVTENEITAHISSNNAIKMIALRFNSKNEALTYLMSRRAMLSSSYQNYVEPYYGLVKKKQCVQHSQFSGDFKEDKIKNSSSFAVRLPDDTYMNLFDCDKGQPSYFVQYHFLYCAKNHTTLELREYSKADDLKFFATQLNCQI